MMKLKYDEFEVFFENYLQAIAKANFSAIKTMLHCHAKLIELEDLRKPFISINNMLVGTYGHDGQLNTESMPIDKRQEFFKKWQELQNTEVGFDFGEKIKLSDLKVANKIPNAHQLRILEEIIEIDVTE